jgi:hypothetical protein
MFPARVAVANPADRFVKQPPTVLGSSVGRETSVAIGRLGARKVRLMLTGFGHPAAMLTDVNTGQRWVQRH